MMMENKQGILLETGTNEFEIVEFSVGPVTYGINVAKVREVINLVPVTKIVNAHPYMDGVFKLRGKIIPLVNLVRCLGSEDSDDGQRIIVCEINNYLVGFRVDSVSRIHRISWKQMEPAPGISGSDQIVGIIKLDEKLILLLDFERILAEVNPEINRKLTMIPVSSSKLIDSRHSKTILLAEDSHMLRELLIKTLHTAGYQTISCANGQEAWDKLSAMVAESQPLVERVQLVITDIEMPQMDGHHLTKRIKGHDKLNYLPVVIFSSLINEEMRRKGEAIGAAAQITKPEIEQLISILDEKVGLL